LCGQKQQTKTFFGTVCESEKSSQENRVLQIIGLFNTIGSMDFITLKNQVKSKIIKDVILHPLKINKDESGVLVETLRSDWQGIYGSGREFKMQYYSVTPSGMTRDEKVWHCHPTQEDRFLVAQGAIVVAIGDNRIDSPTNGLLNLFYMQADTDPYIVLVPRKTLHGFMVLSKESALLLNYPTGLYDPKEEGRIPYEKAQVKLPDGSLFSWEKVRAEFKNS
jgi:dTDP-4-dehydrorhamnose 3,5-epimerase